MAYEIGVPAIAANAPPIGNVFGGFSAEAGVVRGIKDRCSLDCLVNIRLLGDPVSGLSSTGAIARVGQTITVRPDPLLYVMQDAGTRALPFIPESLSVAIAQLPFSAYTSAQLHRIGLLIDALENEPMTIEVSFNGEIQDSNLDRVPTWGSALSSRFLGVDSSSGSGPKSVGGSVLAGLLYPTDPFLADGYEFVAAADSPQVDHLLLPLLNPEDQEYFLELFSDGQWSMLGEAHAGDLFDLPQTIAGKVQRFRVRGIMDGATHPMSVDAVFFGLVFDKSGDLSLTITELDALGNPLPVPEPSTWGMLVVGVGVLAWRTSRTRRRGQPALPQRAPLAA